MNPAVRTGTPAPDAPHIPVAIVGAGACGLVAALTLRDAGVMLTFGSDWPGTNASWYTADPMKILYAAATRKTLDGKPEGGWRPEQKLDLETSLTSYTANNAYAMGEEASRGKLMPGMLADLVVLDQDLFAIPPDRIKDVKVVITIVGGRVVFERSRM